MGYVEESLDWKNYQVERVRFEKAGICISRPAIRRRIPHLDPACLIPKDVSGPVEWADDQRSLNGCQWLSLKVPVTARRGYLTVTISKAELSFLRQHEAGQHNTLGLEEYNSLFMGYKRVWEVERWRLTLAEAIISETNEMIHNKGVYDDESTVFDYFRLAKLCHHLTLVKYDQARMDFLEMWKRLSVTSQSFAETEIHAGASWFGDGKDDPGANNTGI